jgi:hypothetical protein
MIAGFVKLVMTGATSRASMRKRATVWLSTSVHVSVAS